jgi:membrane protease YdiL (CAAX protease family)
MLAAGVLIDVFLVARALAAPPDWAKATLRLRRRPWSWRHGGLVLFALVLLNGCAILVSSSVHELRLLPEDRTMALSIALQTALFHGAAALLVARSMRLRGATWSRAFGGSRRTLIADAGRGVLFYLAALPVLAAATLAYRLALEAVGYPVRPQNVLDVLIDGRYSPWLRGHLVVLAVGIAPLVEEVVFRGIALPLLARRTRLCAAILGISLVFALVHFHVPSFVPLVVIAAAFSLAYVYTGSLVVPIVMHALFNAVSLFAVLLLRGVAPLAAGTG